VIGLNVLKGGVAVAMKNDLKICCYDGLPCERSINGLSFGACYVKSLDGKLRSVCRRFKVSPSVHLVENLVRNDLIPR
jgi:hypothetical protein